MPKKTFSVDDFSGGANTFESPQNVAPNELVKCQGFYIVPGEVGVIGDMKGAYTLGGSETSAEGNMDIEPGYGLFTFSHDYNMAGGATDAGTNLALTSTDYFIIMNRDDNDSHNKFDIYDTTANDWAENMIDLGGSSSDTRIASIKPCFFIADGALRISPGNFAQVDSGGDLIAGANGDFITEVNPGGFEAVTTDADFNSDIVVGDTIIIGKTAADAPGQEMVALITASTALTAARNMTGLFPTAVDVDTDNDDVYVMPDTRWRGVVRRKNFARAGGAGTFTEWYSTYANPRPPVTYHADLEAGTVSTQYTMPFLVYSGTGDAPNDGTSPPTLYIIYKADNTDEDATWDGAVVNLYCTALYDEAKQESQPNKIASSVTVAAANKLGIGVTANYRDAGVSSGAYLMNKRVTGARIYYEDTTNDPGILFQLIEVDFEHGCKKSDAETFTRWASTDSAPADEAASCPSAYSYDQSQLTSATHSFIFPNPPKTFTYEINTGYPSDVNTHARYKTATVLNRRLFVGNVYQSGKANGDRMIGSPVNKFDVLPETNTVDVTVGDGDQIVKLEGFADRILQFKRRTLYIINIGGGQGGEFLESQHKNMGVQNPSQTCLTEYGVAWVNSKGVFLFDGQQVTDLTRNKLNLSGDRGEALNVDEDNIPIIGYHPTNKWLVIHPQSKIADAYDVEAWILDFKSGAWTFTNTFTTTDDYKTNMIWTGDDELVLAAGTSPAHASTNTPDFFKYQVGTSCSDGGFGAATKLDLVTKEFDLELPGIRKMLHSVHVTYSVVSTNNSRIEADIIYKDSSGETTVALEEESGGSTYYTEATGFKGTSAAIRTARLTPATKIKKAYTFQLKLHNPNAAYPEASDFKLYNISFNYRMLGVK